MITALVLAGLLGLGLLGYLSQLVRGLGFPAATRDSRQRLEELTVEPHRSRHKIAVIDLTGIITGDAWDGLGRSVVDFVQDQLEVAGEDRAVKAVVLRVDSPGGEVLAADEINRAVREFREEYEKPVVASMGSLAASGGYYVSAPCDWIVANELTITGSIGVIMHSYNYRGLLNKVGVRPVILKSGKFKDMLSGEKTDEEILPEERQMMQALIDETYQRFKEVVRTGRRPTAPGGPGDPRRRLVDNWEEYADGRILSGRQAHDYGFVDELGNFDTAVDRAKQLAEIPDANVIRYQRPFELGNLFRLFGKAESRSVKLELGLDLPHIEAGRLYFLSPTVFH
jgi:protease-4